VLAVVYSFGAECAREFVVPEVFMGRRKFFTVRRRRKLWTLGVCLLTVVVPFVLDRLTEFVGPEACGTQYESFLQAGFYYHQLTRLGHFARNDFTRIVSISDSEGRSGCEARKLHAARLVIQVAPG
jgi:hypothetical protein